MYVSMTDPLCFNVMMSALTYQMTGKLHALKTTVESEYKMAQTKKHSRIIIKPPVYHATGSPLYRDMRQVRNDINALLVF